MTNFDGGGDGLVEALRRISAKRPPAGEICDFCSAPLEPEHSHLVEIAARRILCSCRPCYIVFQPKGAALGRYRAVPNRYREIERFAIDDVTWESLQIPIGLVFLFYNSLESRVAAFYPSPAGATESLLPLDAWDALAANCAELASIEPDVEAVLIRHSDSGAQAFIVPIDAAYELVGLIRRSWKGFDGGEEARAKIDAFFDKVVRRSHGVVTARVS
jgi:hypothetical protein